ncbi:MAG: hypothetical protein WC545_04185 [Patescibacteria group bacterium]
MKKQTLKIIIAVLALALLLPFGVARAAGLKAGESIYVGESDIVTGNLFAAGQIITVDGIIGGDLIATGQTININGRIEGDLIAAAQNIVVNGEIGGNIRIAGNFLTINGPVARNVNAFGSNIVFGEQAQIGWDVYLAGANVEIRGVIAGDLGGQAGQALIAGSVGKNINLGFGEKTNSNLTIAPTAKIGGNLTYKSNQAAQISNQAEINGQIKQNFPETKTPNLFLAWLSARLFALGAALATGLTLVLLGKKFLPEILNRLEKSPAKALLPGLIIFFLLPPLAFILAITLIGLPLALIAGSLWLVGIYLAKILTAILIGRFLLKKINKHKQFSLLWATLLGIIICWLLFAIPVIGWLLALAAIGIGLGGFYYYARQS